MEAYEIVGIVLSSASILAALVSVCVQDDAEDKKDRGTGTAILFVLLALGAMATFSGGAIYGAMMLYADAGTPSTAVDASVEGSNAVH